MKKKIEIEYTVNTSPKILFYRLYDPDGLQEWFAEKVNSDGNIYTFDWNGTTQQAMLLEQKTDVFVKFRWLDEDDESFFEFRIVKHELTNEVALHITDFAESGEKESTIELWNEQISQLKHTLGL